MGDDSRSVRSVSEVQSPIGDPRREQLEVLVGLRLEVSDQTLQFRPTRGRHETEAAVATFKVCLGQALTKAMTLHRTLHANPSESSLFAVAIASLDDPFARCVVAATGLGVPLGTEQTEEDRA